MLVIKVNGKVGKKKEYANAKVLDGDVVQILHMISGG